jgi:hypothetical protein
VQGEAIGLGHSLQSRIRSVQGADGANREGLAPLLRADGDPVGDGTAEDLGQGPPLFMGVASVSSAGSRSSNASSERRAAVISFSPSASSLQTRESLQRLTAKPPRSPLLSLAHLLFANAANPSPSQASSPRFPCNPSTRGCCSATDSIVFFERSHRATTSQMGSPSTPAPTGAQPATR